MPDLDRRSLLAGTAAIGAELLPYARPAQGAQARSSDDAALLALRPLWLEEEARLDEANRRQDEAEACFDLQPRADAVSSLPEDIEAWKSEIARQWVASGVADASKTLSEAAARACALRLQIGSTCARTSAGLAFKLEVIRRCWSGPEVDEELQYRIKAGAGSDETIAWSIVADVLRAGAGIAPMGV